MTKIKSEKIKLFFWCFIIIAAAVVSRFLFLELKPIHSDESVNGWFVIRLWDTGLFKYDPVNYHGPLYFYLLQFAELLLGKSLFTLRFIASLFSTLTVVYVLLVGGRKYWLGAVLICLSPTMIFYGRSGIHESTFVFFQFLTIISLIHFFESKKQSDLMLAMASGIIMFTLKETVALFLVAFVPTGVLMFYPQIKEFGRKIQWSIDQFFWIILSLIIFVFTYSGFGRNLLGLLDFFRAFLPWLKTGTQSDGGHNKPFYYWFQFVLTEEPVLIFIMVCSAVGFFLTKNKILRWLIISSFFQFILYSIIPYKTPWCIISLTPGFYLIASLLVDEFIKSKIFKYTSFIFFSGLVFYKVKSVVDLNYKKPFLLDHPMVYVNSTADLKLYTDGIVEHLQKNIKVQSETIQIACSESWPFPWIFHGYAKLQYSKIQNYIEPNALAYFIDIQDESLLISKIQVESYIKFEFVLRSSGPKIQLWIKKELANIYEGQK